MRGPKRSFCLYKDIFTQKVLNASQTYFSRNLRISCNRHDAAYQSIIRKRLQKR